MGDYTKTNWVEGVTKVGPTNLNKLEQGVADATKQASMNQLAGFDIDGSTATANDTKRTVWRRLADGVYLGSHELFESGSGATQVLTQLDRVQAGAVAGAVARRVIEAYQRAGAPIVTGAARVVAESIRGGRHAVRAEIKSESGLDPTWTATLLDDTGYSDYSRPTVQVGGALPSSPYEGQEVIYVADAANGVAWHLKYRSAQAGLYKWLVIGGSPLQVGPLQQNVGGDTFNNGAGYLATSNTGGAGPNITIPLAGDYDVTLSAYMRHGAAGGQAWMSFLAPGAAAALDIDSIYIIMTGSNVPDIRHGKTVRKTGFTTGTLSARYKAAGGSSVGLFDERIIRAMPVRVG